MFFKSKKVSFLFAIIIVVFLLVFPEISKKGVSQGLLISSNVIIPSLFPFMVCVLMLIKSGLSIKNIKLNNVLYKIFGQNFDMFFVFVLSMIGGYPIGSKLICELYNKKIINNRTANIMLMYCVNAGPAFVLALASKQFNKSIGIILLSAHISSSVLVALFCAKILKKNKIDCNFDALLSKSFSEVFVESVVDASGSMLNICSFIIFFSSVNAYFDYFFENMSIFKHISALTEVTSAVLKSDNIFWISFLLGFSGLSIWCQVFALSRGIKINYVGFIFGRVLHGTLSVAITSILLKVFKIKYSVFSNSQIFHKQIYYSNSMLFFSLCIMLIVLLTFIYSKNNSGKLIKDVV